MKPRLLDLFCGAGGCAKAHGREALGGAEKVSDEVRWIRTYVVEEEDGKLGHGLHSPARHAQRLQWPLNIET